MHLATLKAINEARREGRGVVLATDLNNGDERLIAPGGVDALADAAAKAARADQSMTVDAEGRRWFLSIFNPPLELVVVGAAHIAQPLTQIGMLMEYRVRVIDPRVSFATPARFPGVALSHDWPDEALAKQPLGPRSALAALTHDPKIDDPALAAALNSGCFYVGALGSRKTHAARLERLRAQGFDDTMLARIKGPIGLAIGAKSPAEIAVAILAEITAALRQPPEAVRREA
ncbi:MAG: XdhC family protein [Alphaproteobacteria bacterium]|nr:XdhC family protein [Alphaproteobacteria bacterium]MBV9692602.1 XdhC family protein [Alphaproteobacteria bacterium]